MSVGGNSILDGTKLIKLGWAPQYDLETGLQHSYFIKNPHNFMGIFLIFCEIYFTLRFGYGLH